MISGKDQSHHWNSFECRLRSQIGSPCSEAKSFSFRLERALGMGQSYWHIMNRSILTGRYTPLSFTTTIALISQFAQSRMLRFHPSKGLIPLILYSTGSSLLVVLMLIEDVLDATVDTRSKDGREETS